MPPPDKIRPWIVIRCQGCEFSTAAEFAALEHEAVHRHRMDWGPWTGGGLPVTLPPLPRDAFPSLR